jgi:hypothetical protein
MYLNFNLKFENMIFGRVSLKQVTHGSKLANISHCVNNPHTFMLIVKKLKMN